MFKRDYASFVRDRQRWKSDFDQASSNAVSNFNKIGDLLSETLSVGKLNSKALKMILDA